MRVSIVILASLLIFFPNPLLCLVPYTGRIVPGFEGFQINYIKNGGVFLNSQNGAFGFGFGFVTTTASGTLFTLSVVHRSSERLIWSANRALPLSNSGKFHFELNGNAVLRREEGGSVVWKLDNSGKNASRIELRDSGNLVVIAGVDGASIWESFDHPTDTLITNQAFIEGMKLTSNPSSSNMIYVLEIISGDMVLSVNSLTPQVYWSMGNDRGRIIEKDGTVTSSSLLGNSWRFFDEKQVLLWKFLFSNNKDVNATWIAVLGNNGVISFSNLGSGVSAADSSTKIPSDQCATPEPCGPYYVCSGNKVCRCVPGLARARSDCKSGIASLCKNAPLSVKLVNAGDGIDYFALGFASPFSKKTNLDSCKEFCTNNCSCLGLSFHNSSGNCFLFDWIGSFKNSTDGDSGFVSYIKVVAHDGKHFPYIVIIIVSVAVIFMGVLIGVAFWCHGRMKTRPVDSQEDHSFVNILPTTPVQYSLKDFEKIKFSEELGHGGFGTVYLGTGPSGSVMAVKKLEGIGQGKKEFEAEVSTIGRVHHQNVVHLRGFCAEGAHRFLVYEYLPKGSLEKWIFRRRDGGIRLDWDKRFNIAVGTANGLAYLHEGCGVKIVHCDIKPENILIDDKFNPKVADFGLVKLMTPEESKVFTNFRGTRGYMAPEWLTTYTISEKSDVYSYGMVLIELIRERRNHEPPAFSNFPTYVFEMMAKGTPFENIDWDMENADVNDARIQRAMKTAFWCIQYDMHVRPSMKKVVQMLEGTIYVDVPPSGSRPGSRGNSRLRSISGEDGGTSSEFISSDYLSGPR